MPDGDRFMRRLVGTGRGWGKAYSLASNNSEYLSGQVIKACADNFRRLSEEAIQGAVNALTVAFERQTWANRDQLLSSPEVFLKLKDDYKRLKVEGDYNLVGTLERTVESVFVAYKNDSQTMDHAAVAEKLGGSLVLNLMDSRWLSRVRDSLMEKLNHSLPEQIKWEQNLRAQVLPTAKKMIKIKDERVKTFRAPASKQKKKSTSEILGKALRVLPSR